jgi:hypothetical protein
MLAAGQDRYFQVEEDHHRINHRRGRYAVLHGGVSMGQGQKVCVFMLLMVHF